MNKKWLPFELSDSRYFTLTSSTCSIDATNIKNLGEQIYPYITRTEKNNGIAKFISQQKHPINKGNVITIGLDTQTVFYQEYDFYTGQNIQVLNVKNLTKNIGLFLIPLIKDSLMYLNWGGNGATLGRLKRKKIMLPVNQNNEPDFDWMESFIKTKYNKKLNESKIFRKNTTSTINKTMWSEFKFEDVFDIKGGKRLTKNSFIKGNTPFIGATDSNNGITAFVGNKNNSLDSNVLGVNYNGSVVENFYHPYEAIFSDDVKRIKLKHHNGNAHIYLFLKTCILKQKQKYQYGYKFNTERMKKQIIMLPSTPSGEPDYEYMENYMKKIQNNHIDKLSVLQ